MAEHPEQLLRIRRADSEAKAARLLTTLEAMVATGETPVVSVLARRAGVSRRFIYDHPELRAEILRRASQVADHQTGAIAASVRTTTASLRADLENAKASNRRLETELAALRRRLGELTGQELLAEISQAPGPTTNARVADLEQALFDAQETLARRTEELESARQINRELMGRLNRSG
jgi:chromosome segregation ATPase